VRPIHWKFITTSDLIYVRLIGEIFPIEIKIDFGIMMIMNCITQLFNFEVIILNFLWDPIINVRRSLQKLNLRIFAYGIHKGVLMVTGERGKDLIERITWNPTYQVMDAGCGTGESPKYWPKIYGIEEQYRL
jgi:hypothetical protein